MSVWLWLNVLLLYIRLIVVNNNYLGSKVGQRLFYFAYISRGNILCCFVPMTTFCILCSFNSYRFYKKKHQYQAVILNLST